MDVITAKDLAIIMGVSKQAVMKRAEKDEWSFSNGKNRSKKFHVRLLPEDVRVLISNGGNGAAAGQVIPYIYKDSPVAVGDPLLEGYKNRIALARADLIRSMSEVEARAKRRGQNKTEAAREFIAGYNTGQLMPGIFATLGRTGLSTIYSWRKNFREFGYDYAVLGTRYGNRKGQRKYTEDEFNVVLSFALHPNRLRVSEAVRMAKLSLDRRQIESPSSPDTLRRALIDWKNKNYDKWVFCRRGEKALNDECLPYLERDAGLLQVGEVLVADGHTLNFQILHPFTGKPARMTMITWYDWASCMPVGWEIMPTENVQCVAAGLRRAILTIGKMPQVAYLDNGKAFKAKIFTDTELDFEEAGFYGMFARLGIETIFAWPYNAQSKPVERFFGTFGELERLMPTYVGTSIDDKPAHMLRNEKLHRKIHEKKYGGWVPTVAEAMQIISGWVSEYSQRPHRGLKGLQPGEIMAAGRGPGVDERALRHLMMSVDVKQIHRNGVNLFGRNYYDSALYGLRDPVTIKYDLEDLSSILIYNLAGTREICRAYPVQKVHPVAKLTGNPDDLAAVKEGIRQKRSLKKQTESVARAWVENAPALVVLPEIRADGGMAERTNGGAKQAQALTRGEAERIEAEASRMKVIELKTKAPEPVYMSEPDRYEVYLERECKGTELSLDDMAFMRYFEKTQAYKDFSERFEFLRELWLTDVNSERG